MRQLKYIGVVFAALMLFTACEKEFDAIPEDFATVPEGSDEAWPQTVTIKDLIENFDTKEGLFTIDTIDSPNDIIVRGRLLPMTVRATYINISLYKVWTMTILV